MKKKEFEICSRAIIFHKNKILVCKNKRKEDYFFPGGHLDFGESIKNALIREIREELGVKIKKCAFIGIVDNIYIDGGRKHHELNLVFDTKIAKAIDKSKEDHLEIFFMDRNEFSKKRILPIALKKAITKWLRDKKIFWTSQAYNKTTLNKI